MRLINRTKNTVLSNDVILADTFLKRVKGLLGKNTFSSGQALILEPCISVHTFFMRFPIDVIFADKAFRVIDIIHKLSPNKFSPVYWNSSKVIELPSGTISLTCTQKGDNLSFSS